MSNNLPGNNVHIQTLVEKLRSKINNFTVMDRQGELIGEVKDLMWDANSQLSLIISRLAGHQTPRLLLLLSKLIQKIEPQDKKIFVDINKAEMENLPEYEVSETQSAELEISNKPTTITPAIKEQNNSSINAISETTEVLEEEIVRLLGERLVVDRSKRKVGEVIVRKEIETRMVQVPVRREKLIVEQVSPERKQLAEIDLGQGEILGIELTETEAAAIASYETASSNGELTVRGEFNSPKIASLLLNAIALERRQGCKKVRVQIVVEDAERQRTYQEWFDRSTGSKQSSSNL